MWETFSKSFVPIPFYFGKSCDTLPKNCLFFIRAEAASSCSNFQKRKIAKKNFDTDQLIQAKSFQKFRAIIAKVIQVEQLHKFFQSQ